VQCRRLDRHYASNYEPARYAPEHIQTWKVVGLIGMVSLEFEARRHMLSNKTAEWVMSGRVVESPRLFHAFWAFVKTVLYLEVLLILRQTT